MGNESTYCERKADCIDSYVGTVLDPFLPLPLFGIRVRGESLLIIIIDLYTVKIALISLNFN